MPEKQIREVIGILNELNNDVTVPKNVKLRLQKAIAALSSRDDNTLKVSKALEELDEVADDPNMQPYTRTQLWNVVSILESV